MAVISRVFSTTSAASFETLASGDFLSIGENASLAINGSSAAAIAASSNATIYNSGQVIGGGSAIDATGGEMTVVNDGELIGGQFDAAVVFGDTGNRVFNIGLISGSSIGGDGILFQSGATDLLNQVENYGTIRGVGDDAIQINAGTGDSSNITNFGTIEVLGTSGNALNLSSGTDTVVNAGLIRMASSTQVAIDLGSGNDTLDNSLGTIVGRILAGSGNDTFIGGAGSESFDGGFGTDNMAGGGGNDTYFVDDAADVVTEGAGGGVDTVFSSVTYALAAGSEVEVLQTTNAAGVGAINFTGNEFAQSITGNAGANVLSGGFGNDTLTGGLGNDNFVFDKKLSAAANVDVITDFSHANDTIVLENAVFKTLAVGTLSSAAFRAGTKALDASDRIIYDKKSGNVFYDADGIGAKAQVPVAKLTGSPDDVTRSDFFII